ncbi:MAG: hypothetical protein RLN62_02955 [Rickettsiales bacterium]
MSAGEFYDSSMRADGITHDPLEMANLMPYPYALCREKDILDIDTLDDVFVEEFVRSAQRIKGGEVPSRSGELFDIRINIDREIDNIIESNENLPYLELIDRNELAEIIFEVVCKNENVNLKEFILESFGSYYSSKIEEFQSKAESEAGSAGLDTLDIVALAVAGVSFTVVSVGIAYYYKSEISGVIEHFFSEEGG